MKILLFGGYGMAGHQIARYFKTCRSDELIVTVHRLATGKEIQTCNAKALQNLPVYELDICDFSKVEALVQRTAPQIMINAVGKLNHKAQLDPHKALQINAYFPHWLRVLANKYNCKVIHISTDCVFSGHRGKYKEYEQPDAQSIYGKSKAYGESANRRHITLRTSIIGPDERIQGIGLMQWFLQQTAKVQGFRKVYWNGVTTWQLARAIAWLCDHKEVGGIVHLTAPQTISKYELLLFLREKKGRRIPITPVDTPVLDRTLVSSRKDFSFSVPSYSVMLEEN